MAYRSSAVLDGADPTPVLESIDVEIRARRAELDGASEKANEARAYADEIARTSEARVAEAEEGRRRSLLRALASRPATPESEAMRAALLSERRERDLRQAIARARGERVSAPPIPVASDPGAAQQSLVSAREERARLLSAALAAAKAAEDRVRELALEVDDLERERERIEKAGR